MSEDRDSTAVEWPDEPPTPACNILEFTKRHWEACEPSYKMLAKRLRVLAYKTPRLSVDACSGGVYGEIQSGSRCMAWCPPQVDLFSNIFPFFARRGIGMMLPQTLGHRMIDLGSTMEGAWILWSERFYHKDDSVHYDIVQGGSGMFARLPSAVHWAYLLARFISLQEDGADDMSSGYSFPSRTRSELRFIRTSTHLMEGVVIGMAYLPGEAVYFDAFSIDAPPCNLVTVDAFLL
ncbi:MAG: hypothetical protein PHC53_02450 [Patescibacteria group bacterium]|nr:hypothetical protein [Patescibacteria group bacterium]